MARDNIKDRLIFLATVGSTAYGTNTPHSDIDIRGIFVEDKEYVCTPFKNPDYYEGEKVHPEIKDSAVHEVGRFIQMLVAQNPNIIETLWVDDRFIRKFSPEFGILRNNRHLFLSKQAAQSFVGYANSQLGRISGHNKWINNPQPKRRPKEIDFLSVVWNFTNKAEYNKRPPTEDHYPVPLGNHLYGLVYSKGVVIHDNHEALLPVPRNPTEPRPSFRFIIKFNADEYKRAVEDWKNFWDWKRTRNEARAELEQKYGFDTKHGSHLIRLLRMGIEILRDKEVKVWRPDAKELLGIRNGEKSYEDLILEANELRNEVASLLKTSTLPDVVDLNFARRICMQVYETFWSRV